MKYNVKTATKLALEKQAELSAYVFRNRQEVTQRDVRVYTRNTSKFAATEQNKSAVTDHAISLNHDTHQERTKQVDEPRREVLPTSTHL